MKQKFKLRLPVLLVTSLMSLSTFSQNQLDKQLWAAFDTQKMMHQNYELDQFEKQLEKEEEWQAPKQLKATDTGSSDCSTTYLKANPEACKMMIDFKIAQNEKMAEIWVKFPLTTDRVAHIMSNRMRDDSMISSYLITDHTITITINNYRPNHFLAEAGLIDINSPIDLANMGYWDESYKVQLLSDFNDPAIRQVKFANEYPVPEDWGRPYSRARGEDALQYLQEKREERQVDFLVKKWLKLFD